MAGLSLLALSVFGCKAQHSIENSTAKDISVACSGQIDPKFFNAFDRWDRGNQVDERDSFEVYPGDYSSSEGGRKADNIFFVDTAVFSPDGERFTGRPTPGARVEGPISESVDSKKAAKMEGTLVYPEKSGRTLTLNFTALSKDEMNHERAQNHCAKEKGLRLPTARELLDFCTAGFELADEGRFLKHRCGYLSSYTWTASVSSSSVTSAWLFIGDVGILNTNHRGNPNYVRCVTFK